MTLFAYRSFYRAVAEMTQANGDIPPSSFFDALGAWYATTQAMGVRRQTDRRTEMGGASATRTR